jgi:glycosyltransferase involved in cell wall biosynthesis
MIVKNEAHVIKDTLENLCKYINFSYYVISDTGSTDGTQEIIINFFKSKNINGKIYQDEWKDFGYNRSLALKYAFNKSDYIFIFDADDKIVGNFQLPSQLTFDSYYFKFGFGVTYKRILLVNNRLEWNFIGVLHEYINCINKKDVSNFFIDNDYYIESGKTGDRSKDPEKYQKDAMILEKAYYEEGRTF